MPPNKGLWILHLVQLMVLFRLWGLLVIIWSGVKTQKNQKIILQSYDLVLFTYTSPHYNYVAWLVHPFVANYVLGGPSLNRIAYNVLSVPDEGYSRNKSCTLNLISTLYVFIRMLTEMTKGKQSSPLLILIYVVLNFVKAYMFSLVSLYWVLLQ